MSQGAEPVELWQAASFIPESGLPRRSLSAFILLIFREQSFNS